MDEVAFSAGTAARTGRRSGNLGVLVGPDIERKQSAAKPRGVAIGDQKLQGFSRGDRCHEVHRGVQDTRGFAGLHYAVRGVREDAGQACGLPGYYIQRDCVASYRGAVDPWQGALDGKVVDQVAGLEIVRAIEDQVRSFK